MEYKILILVSLVLFILPVNLLADNEQEEQIQLALHEMYNGNNDSCTRIFSDIEKNYPFHPIIPFAVSGSKYYLVKEESGYDASKQFLSTQIKKALSIYKNQLQVNPNDPLLMYFYATTLALNARILLSEKDWFGILICGIKSIKYINRAKRLAPENPDIIIAHGVFNYYLGLLPKYMHFCSWIMEIPGTKEEGLRQITFAGKYGKYSKYEAQSMLAFIYLYFEGDYEKSLEYSQNLSNHFTANPYYVFLLAEANLMDAKTENIEQYIQKIIFLIPGLKESTKKKYEELIVYLRGNLAFNKGDYEKSEKLLLQFLENSNMEMDWQITNTMLKLGMMEDFKNNRSGALYYYKKCIKNENYTIACQKAEEFKKYPPAIN